MNFGRFDMVLIFSTAIAIILLSFIMPAAGFTDANNTSSSDVPEFNISSSQWDIAGDFPDRRQRFSAPNQGVIVWDQSRPAGGLEDRVILFDDGTDIWTLNVVNNGTDSNTEIVTNLSYFVNELGDPSLEFWKPDTGTFDTVGQVETYDVSGNNQNWTVEMELSSLENVNQSNMTASIDWQVFGQPPGSGQSLLDRMPIVGGILSTADAVGSFLGWIAQVWWWFVFSSIEIALTLVTILLTVMIFAVDTMVWLSTTYFDIVENAPGWAAVIVTIPGIIISVEFAKLGMIGVKLLPFT